MLEHIRWLYDRNWEPAWVFLSALGTIGAVLVALFGRRPSLEVKLRDREGHATMFTLANAAIPPPAGIPARFYHLTVGNPRRARTTAHHARVFVNKIAIEEEDRKFATIWETPVPLTWQFERESGDGRTRDIGPNNICDFIRVSGQMPPNLFDPNNLLSGVVLCLSFRPNAMPHPIRPNKAYRIEVQAMSREVDSKPITIEFRWDGQFTEDQDAMRQHFVIRQI